MYSNIQILMLRLDYIQDSLNLIDDFLYSSINKVDCIEKIKQLLTKINIVSKIDDIINNL